MFVKFYLLLLDVDPCNSNCHIANLFFSFRCVNYMKIDEFVSIKFGTITTIELLKMKKKWNI